MVVLWLTPEAPALWVLPNLQIFFPSHLPSDAGSRSEKISEVLSELVLPDSRRIKASWEKRRLQDLSGFFGLWPRRRLGRLGSFLLSAENRFHSDCRPSLLVTRPVRLFNTQINVET